MKSEIGRSYKGESSEFTQIKAKYMIDARKKTLISMWTKFRKEWPLFDKLPHFAISRLKVIFFAFFFVSEKTYIFSVLISVAIRIVE